MADFNADIKLQVLVDGLNKAVNQVEKAVQKIEKQSINLRAEFGKGFAKQVDAAVASVKRLGTILKGISATGAGAGIVSLVNAFGQLRGINLGPIEQLAGLLSKVTDPLLQTAASFPELTAGIIGATAAAVAFSPQIADVIKELNRVPAAAKKVSQAVQQAFNVAAFMAFGPAVEENIEYIEDWGRAIFNFGDKVGVLQKRLKGLKKGLDAQNASSSTALRTATKYIEIQRRLNEQLREQADLVRSAAGVNVGELEAAKGRNSIKTRQAAESFRTRQSAEQLQIQRALEKLEQRQVSSLDEVLNIEVRRVDIAQKQLNIEKEIAEQKERVVRESRASDDTAIKKLERQLQLEEQIARVRSQRVAREASERQAFLRGNPNQYPDTAFRPDSTLFQRRNDALKATQQRVQQTKQLQQATAGTKFELIKQLAVLKQVAAIGERINKSTEEELKNQRRINRELKLKKARKDRDDFNKRAESLLLGVGFPALFGGGAGSIAGSAAGSFVGTGFGGQIFGGAIGQAIDNYAQQLTALAKSMESATGILTGLENAGYKVDASVKNVVGSLEKAGLSSDAYASAIQEINRIFGPDGAQKLANYRKANEDLSQSFSEAKAAIDAELLPAMTGFLRVLLALKQAFDSLTGSKLGEFLKNSIQNVPGFKPLALTGQALQKIGELEKAPIKSRQQELKEQDIAIEKANKARKVDEDRVKAIEKSEDAYRAANQVLEKQIGAAQAGTDLADENVYLKRQEIIEQEYLNALVKANGEAEATKNAELRRRLALLNLENARGAALDRKAKGAASAGVKSKALQLQQALLQEELKRDQLAQKQDERINGEEVALRRQVQNLSQRFDKETQIIELQRQQALESNKVAGDVALINELYDSRLLTLNQTLGLLKEENLERLRAIQLEKELGDLERANELAAITKTLNREIEDVNARIESPFGNAEAELAVKQARRYEDALSGVNQELLAQEAIVKANLNADSVKAAQTEIENLQKKKQLYQELLPVLSEAEQQELKFQQTLKALQPVQNALANGFTELFTSVIDGTKSVEEVFLDMLKNVAAALAQTAAQMIAEYLVLAAARALAFGGSPKQSGPNLDAVAQYMADGGPVSRNSPYIVGEVGPELFIPNENGTIVSNDKLIKAMEGMNQNRTDDIMINRAAPGSDLALADTGENPYDVARSAMVTSGKTVSTKSKEQKADQTYQEMRNDMLQDINVRYESTVINEQTYVTEEQFRQGLKAGAKQARSQTLKQLRNRPAVRGKAGLA